VLVEDFAHELAGVRWGAAERAGNVQFWHLPIPSMVLLKVHSKSLGIFPLEGDAPGPVDVDRVTLRPSAKRMKIKAWLSQRIKRASGVQGIQPHQRATM
jgi:hypothetical protein